MIYSSPRAPGLAVAAAVLSLIGGTAAPASAATSTYLHMDVENGESGAVGSVVRDDSGHGHHGEVKGLYGGALRIVQGVNGSRALQFPSKCSSEPCPNAMIEVPDQSTLDPGTASFEWGAAVNLSLSETSAGSNVLQKGLYNETGGQWKLQVDGSPGRPSCLVSGRDANGSFQRTKVLSSVSVADGQWHQVLCRRTQSSISIVVDGTVRGSAAAVPVRLSSSAPLTIGAKAVKPRDNDQFFGALDDIVMRLL